VIEYQPNALINNLSNDVLLPPPLIEKGAE